MQHVVGALQLLHLVGEQGQARRGDVVGAAGGPDVGGAPLGADQPVLLQPPQRAVDPARVALAVVQGAQAAGELVAVVGPFGEQQQQAGLEEVARFQVGHRQPIVSSCDGGHKALRAREVVRVSDLEVALVAGHPAHRQVGEALHAGRRVGADEAFLGGRGRTRRAADRPGSPAGSAPRRARRRPAGHRRPVPSGVTAARSSRRRPGTAPPSARAAASTAEINAALTRGRAPSWMSTVSIAPAAMRSASRCSPHHSESCRVAPPVTISTGTARVGRLLLGLLGVLGPGDEHDRADRRVRRERPQRPAEHRPLAQRQVHLVAPGADPGPAAAREHDRRCCAPHGRQCSG